MKAQKLLELLLILGLVELTSAGSIDMAGNRSLELTVCPQGPPVCDFPKIQEAIEIASEGATIRITEGTYLENLVIPKNLKLISMARERTIVKGAEGGKPVIRVEGDRAIEVTIEGVIVTEAHTFGKDNLCFDVLKLLCPIGIQILGQARATLSHTAITRNAMYGVMAWDSAQVSLQDTQVFHNGLDNVVVGISAQAFISYSRIFSSGGRRSNLSLTGSALAVVFHSQLLSGEWGIELLNTAQASITNTQISYNTTGVAVQQSAQVEIRASTIQLNIDGVIVIGRSRASIFDSLIADNGGHGVLVGGQSWTTIQDSRILNNGGWGIAAWLRKCGFDRDQFTGRVELNNNEIRDNGYKGEKNICLP